MGSITGKLIPPINSVTVWEKLEIQTMSIPSSTVPEVMFPKRRNESDITFARVPTISRKPRKRDMTISAVFVKTFKG